MSLPYPWIEVNCGKTGYDRELWIRRWQETIEYFFSARPVYDWNGSKVLWAIHNEKLYKTMTTIWTLKDDGYRTSYQKHIKTFFWVDDKYYRQNRREILAWAKLYKCKVPSREHGWIEMPNDRVELLFRLQWAGKVYG